MPVFLSYVLSFIYVGIYWNITIICFIRLNVDGWQILRKDLRVSLDADFSHGAWPIRALDPASPSLAVQRDH